MTQYFIFVRKKKMLEERFYSYVDFGDDEDSCFEWLGSKNQYGYGWFHKHGHNVQAHRLAYEISKGPIPENLCVCHKCDNPACVNPAHLFIGTKKDNNQDCNKKGRRNQPSGERHGSAKLTEEDVKDIRIAYSLGGCIQKDIAETFGVHRITISKIVNGKLWKH